MEAVASNSNGYELMMVEGYFENRFVGPPVSQPHKYKGPGIVGSWKLRLN